MASKLSWDPPGVIYTPVSFGKLVKKEFLAALEGQSVGKVRWNENGMDRNQHLTESFSGKNIF